MEQSPESKIHNPKWSKHREVKTQSTRLRKAVKQEHGYADMGIRHMKCG